MGEQRFAAQQRWVLGLTAALSAMGALVSLKLPSAVQANVRAAAPAVSSPE